MMIWWTRSWRSGKLCWKIMLKIGLQSDWCQMCLTRLLRLRSGQTRSWINWFSSTYSRLRQHTFTTVNLLVLPVLPFYYFLPSYQLKLTSASHYEPYLFVCNVHLDQDWGVTLVGLAGKQSLDSWSWRSDHGDISTGEHGDSCAAKHNKLYGDIIVLGGIDDYFGERSNSVVKSF